MLNLLAFSLHKQPQVTTASKEYSEKGMGKRGVGDHWLQHKVEKNLEEQIFSDLNCFTYDIQIL